VSITPHQTFLLAALAVGALATVSDLRHGTIPNRLLAAGFLLGLLMRALLSAQLGGSSAVGPALLDGLLGVFACGLLPLGLYAARGLGGGDVKLFMVLGALLGPLVGLEAQFFGFVCGSLYAMGLLAYRGALFRTVFVSLRVVGLGLFSARARNASESLGSMRFAPAIFAGTLLSAVSHWSAP
jgi:prepilin peptidase CpaA